MVKIPDITTNLLQVLVTSLITGKKVVSTCALVGGDEVWVVDAGQRLHGCHFFANHTLESRLKHGSTVHGLSQVQVADIPTSND